MVSFGHAGTRPHEESGFAKHAHVAAKILATSSSILLGVVFPFPSPEEEESYAKQCQGGQDANDNASDRTSSQAIVLANSRRILMRIRCDNRSACNSSCHNGTGNGSHDYISDRSWLLGA